MPGVQIAVATKFPTVAPLFLAPQYGTDFVSLF